MFSPSGDQYAIHWWDTQEIPNGFDIDSFNERFRSYSQEQMELKLKRAIGSDALYKRLFDGYIDKYISDSNSIAYKQAITSYEQATFDYDLSLKKSEAEEWGTALMTMVGEAIKRNPNVKTLEEFKEADRDAYVELVSLKINMIL